VNDVINGILFYVVIIKKYYASFRRIYTYRIKKSFWNVDYKIGFEFF